MLCQKKAGSKDVDVQDLFGPAVSRQQGEKDAHFFPRLSLPLHTQAVLLWLPRRCLKDSGSPEFSEGAWGRNRLVHVVLTWHWIVDHLAGLQAQGQMALKEDHPEALFSRALELSEQVAGTSGLPRGGN